jgi:hypothetical protein
VHLHQPRLPAPALLISMVYAAAVTVAIAHPGRPTLAGLVVLAGLTARWVAYARGPGRAPRPEPAGVTAAVAGTVTAVDAVLSADPDTAAAHVAA